MYLLKLKEFPHFVLKDPQYIEDEKKELFREYYIFLSNLMTFHDSVRMFIKSSPASNDGNSVEVGFLISHLESDFASYFKRFKYLRFEDSIPEIDDLFPSGENIKLPRKIKFLPVGNFNYLDPNLELPPLLRTLNEKGVYKIPIVKRLRLVSDNHKWENLLNAFTNIKGFLSIEIKKLEPDIFTKQYASQCLSLFLNTYLNKLSEEEIFSSVHIFQSLISEEKIYKLDISIAGSDVNNLRLSFLRDMDIDTFDIKGGGNALDTLKPDNEDDEATDFVNKLQSYWTLDELMELICPPFSFTDALPGISHFVPKPFTSPAIIRTQKDKSSLQVGNLENGTGVFCELKSLTQHLFTTGTTGSGKTNTIMGLIVQSYQAGIPFMIIDPVKTEYEELMERLNLSKMIIDFSKQSLQFNPFLPPPNISIYSHCSILARILSILFPTTPVAYEYIINMIKQTYLDCINHEKNNKNDISFLVKLKGKDINSKYFKQIPNFELFLEIGKEWLKKLPGEKYVQEAVEHFQRRWEFLEKSMFKIILSHSSNRLYKLFNHNVLIELYNLLDPGEKNAMFSLLVATLYEYRLSEGLKHEELVHLMVLEEAHRIVPSKEEGWGKDVVNSPAHESSQMLSQILAELRALGQGVIISEQSPSKIIPDVLINTSTKIVHRIVYGNDKDYLGAAMSLSAREKDYLTYLDRGEVIAYLSGTYQPVYLKIKKWSEHLKS
jgi:hypothetical protein